MTSLYDEIRIALHSVWQRRWLALAVAWGVCLIGWAVVSMIPNKYESEARVFVSSQSLLPDESGQTAAARQRDIERIQRTLASAVNLQKVVRGTDLGLDATSDREVADKAAGLQKSIKIVAQQDNLFQITGASAQGGLSDAENAKLARAIVQKLIDIFVEENLAGGRVENSQSLKFLDQQITARGQQLQEAEAKRVAFERRFMGMLPGSGPVSTRIDAARAELARIESELLPAQSALAAVNGQMNSTPATVNTPGMGGGTPSRSASIEAQIADGQAKGWTDNHPDMIALRNQLGRARATGGGGGSSVGLSTPNPMYVTLRSMQAEKQATVAGLSARRNQLQGDIGRFAALQQSDPGFAAEQERISRDYEVLKAQYDKLLNDREQVRLRGQVQIETDAIKFRVIDPPTAPRKPSAPDRPLLLTMVLLAGLGAGVGTAFAQAQLQTSYPTASRLERASGLPVIGSITEIVTAAERVIRLQKLKYFAGGAGALAGAYALLLAVEFFQRGAVA